MVLIDTNNHYLEPISYTKNQFGRFPTRYRCETCKKEFNTSTPNEECEDPALFFKAIKNHETDYPTLLGHCEECHRVFLYEIDDDSLISSQCPYCGSNFHQCNVARKCELEKNYESVEEIELFKISNLPSVYGEVGEQK